MRSSCYIRVTLKSLLTVTGVSLLAIGSLSCKAQDYAQKYKYSLNNVVPTTGKLDYWALAVYPVDYPFKDGLFSFKKTGTTQNVETLYKGELFEKERDLFSYCLYQDLKAGLLPDARRDKSGRRWNYVDYGPNISQEGEALYDLILRGQMDVSSKPEHDKQICLLLILSSPREPSYVRYYREVFVIPKVKREHEWEILVKFRDVNSRVLTWLQSEIESADARKILVSRHEAIASHLTKHWDKELQCFTNKLITALEDDAPPPVLRVWAEQCLDRWENSFELFKVGERETVSNECLCADQYCLNVVNTIADCFGKRDKILADARATEAALVTLAILAAAGEAYAGSRGGGSGAGYVAAAALVATAVQYEDDAQTRAAEIQVDMKASVDRLAAEIPEKFREQCQEKLKQNPDEACQIFRDEYADQYKNFTCSKVEGAAQSEATRTVLNGLPSGL